MNPSPIRQAVVAFGLSAVALAAAATGVGIRDDGTPTGSIFPSNRFTVPDFTQITLRRVNLPKPDCSVRPSDCADVDVLNRLDGFSTQPRITVPFDGDIDPASVTSDTVYFVNLGDASTLAGAGGKVGINQVVWDPATKTLAFQSDELLQQHSRYVVVITDGVRDAAGKKIKSDGWGAEFGQRGSTVDAAREEARRAVQSLAGGGQRIVAASVFTTQSISADLQKIQRAIAGSTPAPIDFAIGTAGGAPVRALFPTATLGSIQFLRQTGTATTCTNCFAPTPALAAAPGAVAAVAYGRFTSPDYQTAAKVIPATGTLTGTPQPQGSNPLIVQMFIPSGTKPAGGWPVAMFGHGFGDSMYGAPWTVAATLASRGIATVSLNVVGHGGGAAGTLRVQSAGAAPVTVPAGGRGFDQDGNTVIDSTEGVNAAAPQTLIGSRDGLRQTVIDYMQLVRQIQAGVDVDGDGSVDLDANRLYYSGQSFGGIYGTIFLGTEPALKAGVPNVPGGSITEIARISPVFRLLSAVNLVARQPSLINLPPISGLPFPANLQFAEQLPLRDEPPRIVTAPGAMDIQAYLDRAQWATQTGNPVSYAPFIRKQPLPGHAPKPVIVQFAKGDLTVPNPTSSAILRAGGLADRATYFRNDLAYAANPALPKNPHTFLTGVLGVGAPYAIAAQTQIAVFFASGGTTVIDPDGAAPIFEVPIAGPLPETLNAIP